jgi:signal transduction histidine kinase/CHASE3 domain sensor protein/FixJ family two-component response regulator
MLIPSLKEFRTLPQPVLLAIGFMALMVISIASIGLAVNRQFDADRIARTLALKNDLATLMANFRRAESTQRAYLLTGEPGFMKGHREAINSIMPVFERVRRASADKADQQQDLADLEPVLRRKLEGLRDSILRYEAGDNAGALESFRNGEARELTGKIREAVRRMDQAESERLAVRSGEAARADLRLLIVDLIGIALIIGLAAISIRMVRRSMREREVAIQALAHANIGLESTVAERTDHLRTATEEAGRIADILNSTFMSMADAVIVVDANGKETLSNPAADRLLGPRERVGSGEWRTTHLLYLADGVTPFPIDETPIRRTLRGETVDNVEVMLRGPGDAKAIHGIASGRPIRDSAGGLRGAVTVFRDVTIERETERQLRQSQKMDAVGQLTGGVAHDFNNILTVIMTTIEILADAVADRPHLAMIARMIDDAADRGAALTQQLLAFARKQPLDPRSTDINRLIMDAAKLLRPTLGEHMDIACVLDEATSPALVDPSQLTTALLNLAINARDAMPEGGKLTIGSGNITLDETHANAQDDDVKPGAYVMVSVSDTGIGIPEAIRDKVFEPFFTTKGAGHGTGLGLSMVYGFVKQSGGHIKIHSEEGCGTTIKIYLPCADAQAEDLAAAPPVVPARGGREAILVVEDDALVRNNVIAQLESLGYATFAAQDAAEAMALIESGHPIDLLFTDVVMPGVMNGRQLAEQVIKCRPSIKVLYTSGYSEDALVHHGRLDPDVLLLPKPYRRTDLDRMVRLALDGSADQTEDHIASSASVVESQIIAESEAALP